MERCVEYFVRPQTDREIKASGYLWNVKGTGEKKVLPALGRSDRKIKVCGYLRNVKGTGKEKVLSTSGRSQWTDSEVQASLVAPDTGISVGGGVASLSIFNTTKGLSASDGQASLPSELFGRGPVFSLRRGR